jgi:predicted RNA-binding protein (TIGR00451 family)
MRCKAHQRLYEGFTSILEHSEWLSTLDLITKKSGFKVTSSEAERRPEVLNAKKRIERVDSECLVDVKLFGETPAELLDIYPFNSLVDDYGKQRIRDLEKVRALMDYQFGKDAGALITEKARIKKSRATERIRWIYEGKEMIASVRASDHLIIPHEKLALQLKEKFVYPRLRVVMTDDEDAVKFVKEGKSVMCKYVKEVDPELRCGDECIVVDGKDNFIRTGTLALSPKEVLDFQRGAAVKVR